MKQTVQISKCIEKTPEQEIGDKVTFEGEMVHRAFYHRIFYLHFEANGGGGGGNLTPCLTFKHTRINVSSFL